MEGSNVLFATATISAEWEQHINPISKGDVMEASNSYKGSTAEKCAILREIIASNGSIVQLLNSIPFMRREDEPRIIEIIREAMANEEIPRIAIKKLPKRY